MVRESSGTRGVPGSRMPVQPPLVPVGEGARSGVHTHIIGGVGRRVVELTPMVVTAAADTGGGEPMQMVETAAADIGGGVLMLMGVTAAAELGGGALTFQPGGRYRCKGQLLAAVSGDVFPLFSEDAGAASVSTFLCRHAAPWAASSR
jgi:hypothetical protein